MPSGRTHDRITLWSLPWIALGTWLATKASDAVMVVVGTFLFSGLMFGPDLDINSRQFQRWGWFRFFWIPYQKTLRHRSFWSHGLIFGTLGRCLYLFLGLAAILLPGVAVAAWLSDRPWQFQIWTLKSKLAALVPHELVLYAFFGLELGAMSHSLSDWLGSAHKQRQRQRQSPRKSRKR